MSRVVCLLCGWRERGDPRTVEADWNRHYAANHAGTLTQPKPQRRRKGEP